jgi:hypothetical protein
MRPSKGEIMLTREQKDAMLARQPEWVRKDSFVIQAEAAAMPKWWRTAKN